MKLNSVRFFIVTTLACVLLQWASTAAGATNSVGAYRTDQILIKPKAGIAHGALEAFHAAQGVKVKQVFRSGGTQLIAVPANETVQDLIAKYQKSGLVEFSEPDYTNYHLCATMPNDPAFVSGLLWGLYNYGQSGGTPGADIDAPDAWGVLNSASNIVVAVLDSGILATHEDLASNMWVNPVDGGHGFNAFDGTNDPADDSTSHGTMMAGVMGAVGNNGVGVTGVAWRLQMMDCKCFNNGGASTATIVACIDYAVANGARIINASFGASSGSAALSNAIAAAQSAGIIWVNAAGSSAGNDDTSPFYPPSYNLDNMVSVAATTRSNTLSQISNYGATTVALAAPGEAIYSTFDSSNSAYYPNPNSGLYLASSSYSAAYVSGALALMMAKYPAENYHQIIARLLNATDPLPALQGKCVTGGSLNLRKALNPDMWLSTGNASGGGLELQLSTGPNRVCTLQSSSDLVNWTSVYTNTTATNGIFDFTNTAALPSQFFRATTIP
ncbi:MAG TPA: S8 family serine peptidase [Verrucomicrobiae bacterium]|jgi:hypothetical protein